MILVTLFWVQSQGTARVAALFGPIMIVFFLTIGALGAMHIPEAPQVLRAFDLRAGLRFLIDHGWIGFAVLGSVFLGVTGAEALYADMGHFGRLPIQVAWTFFVLPALLLNYLGQGALILSKPEAIENPFFLLAPEWLLLPLVILSTVATVIASQAVVTGAFSLARSAIQLGLLPRLEVTHTSEMQEGQIYIGRVNRLLLDRRADSRPCVQKLLGAGLGLWHRRDRHDGDDDGAGFRRRVEAMALAAVGLDSADLRLPRDRSLLPRGQSDEGQGWRLGAAAARGMLDDRDVDLGSRHASAGRKDPSRLHPDPRIDRGCSRSRSRRAFPARRSS